MVNTHQKGSNWRRAVQAWLTEAGWHATYRPLGEAGDDITATRRGLELSVEAKNHRALDLAGFLDQTERQAGAHQIPVLVVHRTGHSSVEDAYVVLSGATFRRLMEAHQ